MKVYIAARYSRKAEVAAFAVRLRERGIKVTSRWHDTGGDAEDTSLEMDPGDASVYAEMDLEDVRECDTLVLISENGEAGRSGGRHVEFGYALALGKNLAVIGKRENIFHTLYEVRVFDGGQDFSASLSWMSAI